MVVVASLAAVAQEKGLALQLLKTSFSQTSAALSGQVGDLAGKLQDGVECDDRGRFAESLRTLLGRTARSDLSTLLARAPDL